METGGPKKIQPHDALMRAVLSNPVDASAEVRSVLPPDLVARLDPDHLELQSGTFIRACQMVCVSGEVQP
jgi:hypothetical protein